MDYPNPTLNEMMSFWLQYCWTNHYGLLFLFAFLLLTCMSLQVNLGNMYYNGLGVTKDRWKAKELYRLAADKDDNAMALLEEIELDERKEAENGLS